MQLLEETGYHPDLDSLPGMITDKTRLLILNSPENPCGSALTNQELETIANVVLQHPGLYVLADEIYKDILYNGEHFSISSIPGMQERTIILDGFSKSYAMTGWRLGYGIMPEELVPLVVKLAVNSVSALPRSPRRPPWRLWRGLETRSKRWSRSSGPPQAHHGRASQYPRYQLPRARGGVLRLPQYQGHRTDQHRIRGTGDE